MLRPTVEADFSTGARMLVAVLLVLALALTLQPALEALQPTPVPGNYNEGWNAYHAQQLLDGQPLYTPDGAGLANNYPPLSFVVVAGVARLCGGIDVVSAGRLVAFLCLLAVVSLQYVMLIAVSVRRWVALAVSLATYCFFAAIARGYVAVYDPQWLGEALSLAGAALLLRRGRTTRSVMAAAALMAIANFTKNAFMPLPAATALWLLWMPPRRDAFTFVVTGIAVALCGVAVCVFAFGPVFLASVLHTPRVFSLAEVVVKLRNWAPALALVVPLSAWSTWTLWRVRGVGAPERYALLYAGLAYAWMLLLACGAGIGVNALFEPTIASFLLFGLVLERLLRAGNVPAPRANAARLSLVVVVACLGAAAALRVKMHTLGELQGLSARHADALVLEGLIAASPGPVACESLVLCFWAGRQVEFDYFNLGQRLMLRADEQQRFIAEIEAHRYSLMQFDAGPPAGDTLRLPPAAREAIERNYVVVHRLRSGVIAVPRPPGPVPGPAAPGS